MESERKSLSVVLPVYNEGAIIESVIKGIYKEIIRKYPGSTLIVAEDGSTDNTKDVLRKLRKKIPFRLAMSGKRKGYLTAVKDALMLADSELVFFSDTDGTHDPRDFWRLYERMAESGADIVAGVKENRHDPLYRLLLSRLYNFLIGITFGLWIKDSNAGFKLMKRELVKEVVPQIKYLKYGFSSELLIRARHAGKIITPVAVKHFPRKKDKPDQFALGRIHRVVLEQLKGMIKLRVELLAAQS